MSFEFVQQQILLFIKFRFHLKFLDAIDNALPKSFNGSFILKFGSYYDLRYIDGLKTGKCIDVADSNVKEIKGYFVNDVLKVCNSSRCFNSYI